MNVLLKIGAGLCTLMVLVSRDASAQIPGFSTSLSQTQERLSENHWRLTGAVEIARDDMKFYADQVDYYTDTARVVAMGNVVFTQTDHRIAADRADFSTRTRLGTFFNASGIATLGAQPDLSMFGSLQPDVYFYGETIEKIGPDRYRITRGGFTTCVQPTPRWELTSTSVVLHLEHYAVLRNSLLKVKGLPLVYLPIFYYPIKKDNRATGFLIPHYGASTIRGQTISNAFFWALGRSHDVTLMHDWFSRAGQGGGAEYRYVAAPDSQGEVRTYLLREHEATYVTGGVERILPARRSYQITGTATQVLGQGFTARGRADYFSDITVQQTYNTNIYNASRSQRIFSGALTKAWFIYTVNGSYDRTEFFSGATTSTLTGGTPRITGNRAERPIRGTPLYVSLAGDYSHILRETRQGLTVTSSGLDRLDVAPVLRFPFTRWQFFTVNSSVSWRNTFWSDSRDATGTRIDAPISRRYLDMQAQILGPVFNRIWDTPDNGYAEKFKHSIEPFLNLQRTTSIDNFNRIVQLDAVDAVIGRMTRYTYGVNNRFYAKRKEGGPTAVAREMVGASIQQTYYTDARAAQYDLLYRTSFNGVAPPTHFSPVSLLVRAAPTSQIAATLGAEYDSRYHALRTISAAGTVARGDWVQATAGWSQRRFVAKLPGFNDRTRLDHFLNGTTTLKLLHNRYGVVHTFNYDALHRSFLQQRIAGYYNAQCCGLAVEYQTWDLKRLGSRAPVPQDHRFSFSFSLAGLGTFANFFGALTGAVR